MSVIVLEIKTGVLAGSFLASGRLEMSEMSEVSVELRVYAVRERKCWTETEILDVLKEAQDYALDSPLPLFSAYDKLAEKFRTALEARISYRHLLVQVSEGDHPPRRDRGVECFGLTKLGTCSLSDSYPQGTRHCCTSRRGLDPRLRTVMVSIWSS